ncbi:MAG: carbamoyl phosphate synthase large subunit [Candidatus Levybacteria bacterium RIFCSPHIGHO2_01_FULL_42_15]|nr:MAG: carbamoyl phosphate synthase large subunit [Candidatus Levybacteria bacterium RIFCSPHIGHO2_01_FULL_42_15]
MTEGMKNIKKVLILGSGALKIGEAGEFDYSGSQAIKALKEERIQTVLINPNIATIQTSKFLADTVYFLPVKDYFVEKIIEKEKPDGILLSFGGQTALNCGLSLSKKGVFAKHYITVLGTPVSAILITEDRKKFAAHLQKIGITTPKSLAVKNIKQALKAAETIGFPVMIRAGFALGGQGSGVAKNEQELFLIAQKAFSFVPQILVEEYLHHYKEIEYEVVRDTDDNCIAVCNMENMDPLGIHTGDSIVVAPSQTLTNFEYHYLRAVAIRIVRSLRIVGECNVQFALNPKPSQWRGASVGDPRRAPAGSLSTEDVGRGRSETGPANWSNPPIEYYVIEVNARLSRSSALASKATGYPLAYVAAKLALKKNLITIKNKITHITQSCFEPSLDYVVVKIPRWDIEKFQGADERIGTGMKSVGEVMGIGRTFEEAYQKAIRMLDLDLDGATSTLMLTNGKTTEELLMIPTPRRMFAIAKAIKNGLSVQKIYSFTGIDPWFLYRIKHIVDQEKKLSKTKIFTKEHLWSLKRLGFSDKQIGNAFHTKGLDIRKLRKRMEVEPSILQIDTLAAEFPAKTNYLYLSYSARHNDIAPTKKKGVIVLGSGPYRIGCSVEFDWTSVITAMNLKTYGKKSIMINCNPETVSTDYDISSKLYFEGLTFEDIADIYDFECPFGVIVSMGGQTPNNRAKALKAYGCIILGTDPADIDKAEDRGKFSKLLDEIGIEQPAWNTFARLDTVLSFCEKVGYPVLIRPSFVLSGTMMRICYTKEELTILLSKEAFVSKDYPITVSKFIEEAKEIEFDAVAQGGRVIVSVISEHVENAGVHSGDATIVLPPQKIYIQTKRAIEDVGEKIARALFITGPFNIQFLAKENNIQVIEINLRSSRTFPFISKVTGIDFIKLSVDAFFHKTKENPHLKKRTDFLPFVAVKVPQFSFTRLTGADPVLHVEMASTGEVACFGETVEEAFLKGDLATGGKIPEKGIFISLGGEEQKHAFLENAQKLAALHLPLFATEKTAAFLKKHGIHAKHLYKIYEQKSPNVLQYFQKGIIDLAINLIEREEKKAAVDQYTIRRAAIDYNIPLFTNRQKATLFINAITQEKHSDLLVKSWDEYVRA